MKRVEVTITGPVQSGKTILLAAIEKAINDLGCRMVLSQELESERNLGNPDMPQEWELESLRNKTYVVLSEKVI